MAEYSEKLLELARREAAQAQEYAKQFRKSLDYSDDSLVALEEILEIYSDDLKKYGDIPEQDIWSTAAMFGAYLGEFMLKKGLAQLNYRWDNPDNGHTPVLYNAEKNFWTAPVDKCYKRLVNGREDSLIPYYYGTMEELSQQLFNLYDLKTDQPQLNLVLSHLPASEEINTVNFVESFFDSLIF